MTHSPSDLLGRLAVHYKLISMAQLNAATREQGRSPQKPLGRILVELGFISEEHLAQLLAAQEQYLARQGARVASQRSAASGATPPLPPSSGRRASSGGPAVSKRPPETHAPAPNAAASARHAPEPSRRPAPPPPSRRADSTYHPARIQWLHKVLAKACDLDASDILLRANAPVKIRVYGNLLDMIKEPIRANDTEAMLVPLLADWQRDIYFEEGQIDFSYEVSGLGRFRANVYRERNGCSAVFHYIPAEPPTFEDLGLPSAVARVINHQNGIVLITGAAGSGKTSTMSALINLLNEERTDHILSIEDPVEYLHRSKGCIVNQRQVNRHTRTFAAALRSGLRADPDVICVGELRDLETISLALSGAETGHLVLGTIHTAGAVRTVNRIVGAYPPSQQGQVRTMLSESLRAIISQNLLPRADKGGVVLAYELLLANHATANMIRENRTFQINSVLQTHRTQGMRSMDDSLEELLRGGIIDRDTALLHAQDRRRFDAPT